MQQKRDQWWHKLWPEVDFRHLNFDKTGIISTWQTCVKIKKKIVQNLAQQIF